MEIMQRLLCISLDDPRTPVQRKKSIDLNHTNAKADSDSCLSVSVQTILTCKLRNEILRTKGEEFDLYLRGLRFRDFANETSSTNCQHCHLKEMFEEMLK